jgi:hypothetical protein
MRTAQAPAKRSGKGRIWGHVEKFTNKIVGRIESTLYLSGNASAPQREARARGGGEDEPRVGG